MHQERVKYKHPFAVCAVVERFLFTSLTLIDKINGILRFYSPRAAPQNFESGFNFEQ